MAEIVETGVADPVVEEPKVEETKGSDKEKTQPQTVPYARFKEVVGEKNTAVERLTDLETKLQNQLALTQDLQQKYTYAEEVLMAIRGMAADEKMRPHVMAIDAKLKGVEEEVETGEITQEEGDKKVEKILKQHKNEVQDIVQTNRAEMLFQTANERASRYLESLPAEYTDKDKEIIGRIWTQEVNWDGIESDPTSLNSELAESLDRVLNWYGEPKGYLPPPDPTKVVETKPEEPTPAMKVKSILDKEWGKIGERGNFEYSDEDFRREAAELIRLTKKK